MWTSQVKIHVDSSSYALLSRDEHLPITDYRPGPRAMVALDQRIVFISRAEFHFPPITYTWVCFQLLAHAIPTHTEEKPCPRGGLFHRHSHFGLPSAASSSRAVFAMLTACMSSKLLLLPQASDQTHTNTLVKHFPVSSPAVAHTLPPSVGAPLILQSKALSMGLFTTH